VTTKSFPNARACDGGVLLDTNVAIHLRDATPWSRRRWRRSKALCSFSVVTRVELEGGVYREPAQAPVRRARLDAMLSAIPALAFDDPAAKTYGDIVASAGYSRRKLLDRMIAAQALVHRATLATFNQDDLSDVLSLSLLVWPSKQPKKRN
jgi:tRNA(fMet)-specific endonuclease VapC